MKPHRPMRQRHRIVLTGCVDQPFKPFGPVIGLLHLTRTILTIVVTPLVIILLNSFAGPNLHEALTNLHVRLFQSTQAIWLWVFVALYTGLFMAWLAPVIRVWKLAGFCHPDDPVCSLQAIRRIDHFRAASLAISLGTFGLLGLVTMEHPGQDRFLSMPTFYLLSESLVSGLLAGVLVIVNLENHFFPVRRLLLKQVHGIRFKADSIVTLLALTVLAVTAYTLFQGFSVSSVFYFLGSRRESGFNDFTRSLLAQELLGPDQSRGIKDVLGVFGVKLGILGLLIIELLTQVKLTLKKPIKTVLERLQALNREQPAATSAIELVNNNEFDPVFQEINQLVKKQWGLLETSRQQLADLMQTAADPILMFGADRRILAFNPAACRYFGCSGTEAVGQDLAGYFNQTGTEAFDPADARSLVRLTGRTASGQPLQFEAHISVSDTPAGPVHTAILRDISASVEIENRLREAREAAERANHLKSEFLANMSHELRTPLNAVLGFTQLLRHDRNLTPTQLDRIRIINNSGEHLLALINDILDISKIEAGKMDLHQTVFDLPEFVNDLKDMFALKARQKGLSFHTDFTGEVPRHVRGDLGKLRQVMINLVGNAVKFTADGGVGLVVGLDQGLIRFSVNDTGRGIPAAELEAILQPFVQSTLTDHEGGTGLGLAISRSFLGIMGSRLEITSTPGQGSTFSFAVELPAADSPEPRRRAQGRATGLAPLSSGATPAVHILIVDDQETNRLVLKEMLESTGLITMEARNGQEALDLIGSFQPRAVFMDIKMPVMDGYEACRRIKAGPAGAGTTPPVVFALTASAFKHDESRIREAGFDGFLAKPFKQDELFALLEAAAGIAFIREAGPDPAGSDQPGSPAPADGSPQDPPGLADLAAAAGHLEPAELAGLQSDLEINDFTSLRRRALELARRPELNRLGNWLAGLAERFQDEELGRLIASLGTLAGLSGPPAGRPSPNQPDPAGPESPSNGASHD